VKLLSEVVEKGNTMGRTKPRPQPQPQGEQQLSHAAWAQIVKTIRELSR
jgi:hypothetical protein